jgi:uncharacterized repeat protein (TIGR03803 family)
LILFANIPKAHSNFQQERRKNIMAMAAFSGLYESIRPAHPQETGFVDMIRWQMIRRRIWFRGLPHGIAFVAICAALLVLGSHRVAAQESVLASFTNNAGGCEPSGNLILDSKGNLYGTNSGCGTDLFGVVFELTPNADGGWTEIVLHTFAGDGSLQGGDGSGPAAGLVFDAKGNLYGTTRQGGGAANTCGTVFELSPNSDGTWTETILHSFDCSSTSTDGYTPLGDLVFDAKGNLYGTTSAGGGGYDPSNLGGTVFELSPQSGGAWTESILHSFHFTSGDGDGCDPRGGLVFDASGNLYGTADECGANNSGAVFELSPHTGGPWTEQVIHNFIDNGVDGYWPFGSLIIDGSGNLYGTTTRGGSGYSSSGGTVFEMSPQAGGTWTEQILFNFAVGDVTTGGVEPEGSLTLDAKGNLYGTTSGGGADGSSGLVFEMTNKAGVWIENILHSFTDLIGMDGYGPRAGVVFDPVGNLYGTTVFGGLGGDTEGAVFEIASSTPTAAKPVFSPAAGTYTSTQSVVVTDTTAGSAVYYTTNGKTPTTSSSLYTGAIIVPATETIEAIAVAADYANSAVASATYTIKSQAATPEFSVNTGTYTSAQTVTITDTTGGASIYYTTNGTTPSASSTKYTGAITVSSTETLEAIAVTTGYTNSPVASATYTIQLPTAATPIFAPAVGSFTSPQSVVLTDTTTGATIYYTTNGTTPTTASTRYTAAITVSSTETIKALAAAADYNNSAVASATYTIQPLTAGALQFIPVTPCRIADTRNATGALGGPELAAAATRTFDVPQSACGIPATAAAYSLNVTVVPIQSLGYLTIWPAGEAQPTVSTLNSDGRVKANATITPGGTNGRISVFASDATQFILDIDGYFVPAGTSTSGLEFFPLTPCRVADTRNPTAPLGGPSLTGGGAGRAFPVQSSACGIPSTAKAYSLNITAVPHGSLGYLTTWPTGQAQPVVSTLNSSSGAVTANAAIVPAGSGGEISVFVSDTADVILDVNGYFAPPARGGLSLYTVTPCRALDTRSSSGAFDGTLTVPIHASACAPPTTAQAYVLNATVIPASSLSYLTLWAAGGAQPDVSTLNANDGAVTSNMAIVPTSNESVDAFATDTTQLILDLSSYFAP